MGYYVVRDGGIIAETQTKELAVNLIRLYQASEKPPFDRSDYSIIEGRPQELISYQEVGAE